MSSLQPLRLYRQILRIIPRTFKNDLEMQATGRNTIREYYENRRNETDGDKIQQYMEEAQGAITVLTEEIMQLEITERDKYGNPTSGVANVRPEQLKDPPMGNTLSARDLSEMRKQKKNLNE